MVKIKQFEHREKECLGFFFKKDMTLVEKLRKKFPSALWSKTHQCWYVIDSVEHRQAAFQLFRNFGHVDYSQLQEKSKKQANTPAESPRLKAITAEQQTVIQNFEAYLKRQRYSPQTIKTYTDALAVFLRFHSDIPPEAITDSHLTQFNDTYIIQQKRSSSYQNQVINAVKLFSKSQQNVQLNPELILRPRREKHLPNVLSKEEVKAILGALQNTKHKMMLTLIYACGLRRSELLNLKPADILSERHLLHIKQSKGKKDRVVPISDKLIEQLRTYYKMYRPKVWLFEGQVSGEQYSETSLQVVLKQALKKCKITKPVTLHWLRHSYATHLLENGTDLRYIQELLGHSSSRTTEIYTHVSNHNIQSIRSPFDYL